MKRILVIDGNEDILEWVSISLSHAGLDVHTADSATAALKICPLEKPAVILLDNRVLGMPMIEFIAALHELAPRAELVLFTTALNPEAAAAELGLRYYVRKPAEPYELNSQVWTAFVEQLCCITRDLCAHSKILIEELSATLAHAKALQRELQVLFNTPPRHTQRIYRR